MVLTRQEKERLVIDLYNQGKNTRDIAKQVGISFRDIGTILQEAARQKEREQHISASSQAFTMFSEGKTPILVAIKLNLREEEVAKLHTEYCKLCNRHALNTAYEEVKEDQDFLELYRLTKAAGMSSERITRTLKIANGDLLSIESKYLVLKSEISYWETRKQNLSTLYWELEDQIHDLNNKIESLYCDCRERALELRKLQIQKVRLEAEIYKIQNSGEIQSKIREMAKREVEGFLSNRELISKLIFESVIKSMRNEPALFPHPQYDSIPSGATTESFST